MDGENDFSSMVLWGIKGIICFNLSTGSFLEGRPR